MRRDGSGSTLDAVPFPGVTGHVGTGEPRVEAGGIDLTGVDGVLVRMMPPGSLEQVVFRMDALHRVAAAGVPVLNPPRAVEAAVDKYLALALLDAAGLPVPPTWVGESAAEALAAFEALGGDVVVKPLFGSEGRGMVRVSDLELARRTFRTLERLGAVLYVQRTIRHPGHDLRAFVLGDRVLGAIRRHAADGRLADQRRPRRPSRALSTSSRRPSDSPSTRPGRSGRGWRGWTSCTTSIGASSWSWRSTPSPAGGPSRT